MTLEEDVKVLADHVTRFSLAGILEIRNKKMFNQTHVQNATAVISEENNETVE